MSCPAFEIFYGGARGGGKTDGVLGEWISHANEHGRNAIGLMVRRNRTQLIETIERSRVIYAPLGATYHEQEKMWRFPGGARLRFAYLERDSDADGYQGHSYTRVYVEEIGTFPSSGPIMKLMATLRSGSGVPVGFRATGNPGGPGQAWVRARYIDPAPSGWVSVASSFKNPWTGESVTRDRIFIPSKLQDNRYLGDEYVANLFMSGSSALVKAWLEGDWNAIEGAFFDGWEMQKHVVEPFEIPAYWTRIRGFDWGFAKPFATQWWTVASEPVQTRTVLIPRGCLILYRQWYGSTGSPDVGLRMEAEEIAKGIIAREGDEKMALAVADTQVFAQEGAAYGYRGPTIGERLNKTLGASGKTIFMAADKSRRQGWDQMRGRLLGDGDGNPMMVVFSTCTDFVRTVPTLQHDDLDPEDLDTEAEDHDADCARYSAMSRPYARPTPKPDGPVVNTAIPTLAQLVKQTQQRRAKVGGRI